MSIVYQHRRLDTDEIFYIGIGLSLRRAYSKSKRNKFWQNIVSKSGYHVDILYDNIEWDDACKKEKELISLYGRRCIGTGILTNINEGGTGNVGYKHTEEYKEKMSMIMKSKPKGPYSISDQTNLNRIEKIKEYYRINGSPNKGIKRTDEFKQYLSKLNKGKPGRPASEETKKKLSDMFKGRKGTRTGAILSDETKNKMSNSAKIRDNSKYKRIKTDEEKNKISLASKMRPRVECPHCNKIGDITSMTRWHFNNCKQLNKPTI